MSTTIEAHPEVIPVRRGEREIGAYVVGAQQVRYVPAVDMTAVLAAAVATAAVVSVGMAVRGRPAIGTVSMGPGGWISLKRTSRPRLRAAPKAGRPWWAHLLRAHRLVVEH